ncbi:MAG: Smr protein/MutS2 [Bacteroidetes bacterium]|nr:MAG: Smr protein/MutS2 [Bacteroidota bacterium]
MKLQKGDKVRFLNEKGEGVITRFLGNNQVMVEVEDGFEFPFPVDQLVPSDPIQKTNPPRKEEKVIPAIENNPSEKSNVHTRQPDGIYLALIPQNQHFPSAGKLDLVLFNHTEYDIYYTLSLKEQGLFSTVQGGTLGPRRQADVESLTPQEVDNWATIQVDLLFFSEEPYEYRAPVSEMIRFRGVKLFKDSTYTEHLLSGKKACVFEVLPLEVKASAETKPLTAEDIRRMMQEKEKQQPLAPVSKPHLKNQLLEKEVDLHIEELLDNWSGMSNAQLLDVQLKRMQQELDEAIAMHLRKIIFIHGVGNGRLKNEIRRVLSTYKGIRFHDGSFQKYGFGATEVIVT